MATNTVSEAKQGRLRLNPMVRRVIAHVARLLPPLLVLAIFFWVLLGHGARPKKKIVLSRQESADLVESSRNLLGQGKYDEALKPTLTLHEAYPDNQIYIGTLADIYDHLGKFKEEAETWETFMDHAPTPIEACPKIGQAYLKSGNEKGAITAFERCLALDSNNPDSYFYLAHTLELAGQTDRAAELYDKGLKLAPNYEDLRLGLARMWLRQDKVAQARDAALAILAKSPDKVDALLTAGMALYRLNDYAQARKYLTHGVQLSDNYADFHRVLALVAEAEKDNAEAARQYGRVVELDPSDAHSRARRDALAKK
jgi:tetratricopeptide (TPR) repeat protein